VLVAHSSVFFLIIPPKQVCIVIDALNKHFNHPFLIHSYIRDPLKVPARQTCLTSINFLLLQRFQTQNLTQTSHFSKPQFRAKKVYTINNFTLLNATVPDSRREKPLTKMTVWPREAFSIPNARLIIFSVLHNI
jgi:hypothetical protein